MAGNLALVEASPEIGFLLKQTATQAAGEKLFIWLPVEEPYKNTIQSALTMESIGMHWKTQSSYLCKVSSRLLRVTVNLECTLMIFFVITLFLDAAALTVYSHIKER